MPPNKEAVETKYSHLNTIQDLIDRKIHPITVIGSIFSVEEDGINKEFTILIDKYDGENTYSIYSNSITILNHEPTSTANNRYHPLQTSYKYSICFRYVTEGLGLWKSLVYRADNLPVIKELHIKR